MWTLEVAYTLVLLPLSGPIRNQPPCIAIAMAISHTHTGPGLRLSKATTLRTIDLIQLRDRDAKPQLKTKNGHIFLEIEFRLPRLKTTGDIE